MHSSEREHNRQLYRTWANCSPELQLFRQPAWLDLVSDTWTATADDWDRPSYVWPFDTRTKFGLSYLAPPTATPRLGPLALKANAKFPILPGRWSYGWYTLENPRDLWRVPGRARAMATLKLDLTRSLRYSKSLRRRLRRGQQSLCVAPLGASTRSGVDSLVAAAHTYLPPGAHAALLRARTAGLGEVLVVTDSLGKVEAVAGIAFGARETYGLYTLRAIGASADAGAVLQAAVVECVRLRGSLSHDFLAGNLPGPREFFLAFGAQPAWYAQVRASRSNVWSALEWLRAHTNKHRI